MALRQHADSRLVLGGCSTHAIDVVVSLPAILVVVIEFNNVQCQSLVDANNLDYARSGPRLSLPSALDMYRVPSPVTSCYQSWWLPTAHLGRRPDTCVIVQWNTTGPLSSVSC